MEEYQIFLESKRFEFQAKGIEVDRNLLHSYLMEHQKDIVRWTLKKGRRSISIELKGSYYEQNVKNHESIVADKEQLSLF